MTSSIRVWIASVAILIIGAAGLVGSIGLGVGTGTEPGPGMWPAIVSVVVVVSALVIGPQAETEPIIRSDATHVAAALALLVLFILLFAQTGIFFPSLIVLTIWLRFLAGRPLLQSAAISLGTSVGLYALFTLAFGVGT